MPHELSSRPNPLSLIAALVFIASPPPALAERLAFALTEADFFAPMPTVLSAARLVQPLSEAPVAMTVIDREMIEVSSATSVPELLRLVPGFQVTYTEGIDAITTYQGFADHFPKRMQVLIDGRSAYNPGINGIVWSALPLTLNEIERIEVVRGSNAAAYGSNAFLGTINIVTRRPESIDRATARAMIGSADTKEGELSYSARLEQFSFSVTASYAGNDGFDDKHDDSSSRLFNFRGIYHPTSSDTVSLYTGVRDTNFDSEAFRVERSRSYRSYYQHLVWDHIISTDQDIRVQAFHNAFDSPDDITFTSSGLPLQVDYSLATHRYDFEVQHRWSPADGWRVSWGGGYRQDIVEGPGIFDTDDDIHRDVARLFANVEWRARPNLKINAGLMGEDISDLSDYLSPRLAANWHPKPGHTLRLSAARAYRMPTIIEQRGELKVDVLLTPTSPDLIELLGTADNEPERIHSFEIGYVIDKLPINGFVDFRLFHHELERLIYGINDRALPGSPQRFDEAGAIRTTGIEFQSKFRPSSDSLVHIAYAYAKGDGGYLTRLDAFGNPARSSQGNPRSAEPAIPEHTLTVLGSKRFANDWTLSGTLYHVSEMEWLGEGDYVDRQTRVDAKLSKRFKHASGSVEVSLNVHNLFDETYWEFTPPDPSSDISGNRGERRIYAQIKVNLR